MTIAPSARRIRKLVEPDVPACARVCANATSDEGWCKKIRGTLSFFGKLTDGWDAALTLYTH